MPRLSTSLEARNDKHVLSPYTPRRQIIKKLKEKKRETEVRQERFRLLNEKVTTLGKQLLELRSVLTKITAHFSYPVPDLSKALVRLRKSIPTLSIPWSKACHKVTKIVQHVVSLLVNGVWKVRYPGTVLMLLALSASHLYRSYSVYTGLSSPSLLSANRWPGMPGSLFRLATDSFMRGDEKNAYRYFSSGERRYDRMKLVGLGVLYKKDYQQTKQILERPGKRREQIAKLDTLLEEYPYSWQLLATKVWYEQELYKPQAELSLKRAWWLYPDNPLLSKTDAFLTNTSTK